MVGTIKVTICDWGLWQARRDLKTPSWFKCSHDIFEDDNLYDLDNNELTFFWYLLCRASKANSQSFSLNLERILESKRFTENVIKSCLEKLQSKQLVKVNLYGRRTDAGRDLFGRIEQIRIEQIRIEKSNTGSEEKKSKTPVSLSEKTALNEKRSRFISEYRKSFKKRFPKSDPIVDGKTLGLINNFLKHMEIEKACLLIQAYFQIEDEWFRKKGYDFVTFVNNLQKIANAFSSGSPTGECTPADEWLASKKKEVVKS